MGFPMMTPQGVNQMNMAGMPGMMQPPANPNTVQGDQSNQMGQQFMPQMPGGFMQMPFMYNNGQTPNLNQNQ